MFLNGESISNQLNDPVEIDNTKLTNKINKETNDSNKEKTFINKKKFKSNK